MKTEINLKEALKIIKSQKTKFKSDLVETIESFYEISEEIFIYNENTEMSELILNDVITIVNGNLTVNGLIEEGEENDYSMLVVLGNVNCKNLISTQTIFIIGELNVEHLIVGQSGLDGFLNVDGNVNANTIIESEHNFEIKGEINANYISTFDNINHKKGISKPNLVDNVLLQKIKDFPNDYKGIEYKEMNDNILEDGFFDLEKAIEYVKKGGEIFTK